MPPRSASTPTLIGLDWGTSRLRTMLLDAGGALIESHESDQGIRRARGAFPETFAAAIAPWRKRHADLPVYASGMITSRNGWIQTPYMPLPADARTLAHGLVRRALPDGGSIAFVPGLRDDSGPYPDVMRGEETEIIGYLVQAASAGEAPAGEDSAKLLILPGTHTKWVRIEGERIIGFRTFMTGEIYDVLTRHSILGDLMPAQDETEDDAIRDHEAFAAGIATGGSRGDDLLASLFSARSRVLCEDLAPKRIGDYLSGLLIGSEIAQMRAISREGGDALPSHCTIIGRGDLAARYADACAAHDVTARIAAPGAAGAGLAALHALTNSNGD